MKMSKSMDEIMAVAARGEIFVNGDLDSHRIVVSVFDEAGLETRDVMRYAKAQGIEAPHFLDHPRQHNPGWTDHVFKFSTVAEVRAANKRAGHFYFSPSTTQFFGSKYGRKLYGSHFLLVNDRNYDDSGREYKVAEVDVRGWVNKVGKTFESRKDALEFIDQKLSEDD